MDHSRLSLPIDQIGELPADAYVGLIDADAIECLKARLQAEGLHTPIWVRKNGNAAKGAPFSVIAGRHRLRAATALGWTEIAAEVRAGPGSKAEELRQLQVAENLDRRILRPIERACFIMERWRSAALAVAPLAAISQQKAAAFSRWSALSTLANTPEAERLAIDEACAALSNDKPRTIRRYRNLYEKLVVPFPDHFALINAHPLGEKLSHMQTLASVLYEPDADFPAFARRDAIEALLNPDRFPAKSRGPDGQWKDMLQVLMAIGLRESPGNRPDESNHVAKAIDAWTKMQANDRKAHAQWLADQVTPGQAKAMVARFTQRGLL